MNIEFFKHHLAKNAESIHHLVADMPAEQARWKPTAEEWSILEVVNHLLDEEQADFPFRLNLLLHHPNQTWPDIHPSAWAIERKYNERELAPSVESFLQARRESLVWLHSLVEPDWSLIYQHPAGPLSAGDLLAAWLGHDYLHLRQLSELHWAYLSQKVHPYSPGYAGEW